MKKLVEDRLPIRELSRDAAIEMAYKSVPAYIKHCRELRVPEKNISRNFYDPKIRNLHPWFARRPCSIARAITLASVLPEIDRNSFMEAVGWNEKKNAFIQHKYPPLLFYVDPKRDLITELLKTNGTKIDEITVCDPMAGGGTIPFESVRLGFRTIAIEYNPVAFLILKATIEYPSKYGDALVKLVKDESEKLIMFAQRELGSFYPSDSEGYIIARGINCPECGEIIPLLHGSEITGRHYLNLNFDKSQKTYNASISRFQTELPYQSKKRGEIVCPYCGGVIKKREAYKTWTRKHVKVLKDLQKGIFNKQEILRTHILLIKQTKNGYKIPDETDIECFLNACRALVNHSKEIDKYIPINEIPACNEVFKPIREYGIKYWYELFNPRQLVALARLLKYVHERIDDLSSKGELGAAIPLYLALGMSRVVDYNSIATTWKRGTIRDTIGQYARGRRITYGEEYCEAIIPYRNLNWVFEPNRTDKITQGGIVPVLNELCKRIKNLGENLEVIQGDCRFLSSMVCYSLDVINVDPPYFDSHIYSDISEFFWQILRIALKPLMEAGYFFDKTRLENWKSTSSEVPRQGELIVRKSKNIQRPRHFDKTWYTAQMARFFKECFISLKDDGILLTWFTHRSLDAWKAIINALYAGGFYVTKIWPVTSELLTRLVSKGNNNVLNKTLIIVARKRRDEKISETKLKEHVFGMIENMVDALAEVNASETELRTFLLAAGMSGITVSPLPKDEDPIQYCNSKLIPWSIELVDEAFPRIRRKFKEKHQKYVSLDLYV